MDIPINPELQYFDFQYPPTPHDQPLYAASPELTAPIPAPLPMASVTYDNYHGTPQQTYCPPAQFPAEPSMFSMQPTIPPTILWPTNHPPTPPYHDPARVEQFAVNPLPVVPRGPTGRIERTHTTSGRRREQNRNAQRAFRDRKEKHTRDLAEQLALTKQELQKCEAEKAEFRAECEAKQKVIEAMAPRQPDDDDGEGENEDGLPMQRDSFDLDTFRRQKEQIRTLTDTVNRLAGVVGAPREIPLRPMKNERPN